MINKDNVLTLLRELVIRDLDINTFTIVDKGADFEATNTNKSYEAYQRGLFWSREWVLQGADPSNLHKQYPILGVEQKRVQKASIYEKGNCYEFWLLFADQVGCETCTTRRTPEETDWHLQDIALAYLAELVKYQWDGTMFVPIDLGMSCLKEVFEDQPLDIKVVDMGLADKVRGVSLSLKFCNCLEPDAFRAFSAPEPISVTKCETC